MEEARERSAIIPDGDIVVSGGPRMVGSSGESIFAQSRITRRINAE